MVSTRVATAEPENDRLAEAERAIRRGWELIKLTGKVPVHKEWQKRKPATISEVREWIREGANLGLRTGQGSGVIALDDDSLDGSAAAALELPATVTAITDSKKKHYYFAAPEGLRIGNSVKTLADGIDVRGDGGQVVFVGSLHTDTGEPYTWAEGLSPDEIDLAPLPEAIVRRLAPSKSRGQGAPSRGRSNAQLDRYVDKAVAAEVAAVSDSVEGARNQTLNRAAFSLGQLVGAGVLDRERARRELLGAARSIGLGDREAEATIQSGLEGGEQAPRDLAAVLERQSQPTQDDEPDDSRPCITIRRGWLHDIVTRAERVLLTQEPPLLYQRGTSLVQVIGLPMAGSGQSVRMKPMIVDVSAIALVDKLTQLVRWELVTKEGVKIVDCPERIAKTLLSRAGSWALPPLTGVIDCPTLRADGAVLDRDGYDKRSGLYLRLWTPSFPSISRRPSRKDAQQALGLLLELLRGFPFLEDADRSVAVSAILTSLIRPSLRTAPLFAFRAAKMGSGKSLLADVVSMIAAGRPAAVMAQGADENEDKKRFLPILSEGDPVAVIDNIERPFGSAALCSILTQPTWRDRVLGKSQTLSLPTTNTTWIATGNNIQFVGDITTRTLVCDLDPQCERPEEREFDVNLHRYIPEHRGELVAAGLTILRAYHVAGRPRVGLKVFGRFEEWSDWVRSAVTWLDMNDPCATRARVEEADPVRDQVGGLLKALQRQFEEQGFKVADVLAVADPGQPLHVVVGPILSAARSGASPAQVLGTHFFSIQRRIESGLRLMKAGERGGSAVWRVEHVAG